MNQRKNIKLPPNEKGKLASKFLEKLYHYQGNFIASLIYMFLENNNIASEEALDALSDDDAKNLAGIKQVDFNLPRQNLNLQPGFNNNPANNQVQNGNDIVNQLVQALASLQNNGQSLMPGQPQQEVVTTEEPKPTLNSQDTEEGDLGSDDELGDFDMSMINAFRQ